MSYGDKLHLLPYELKNNFIKLLKSHKKNTSLNFFITSG